MAKEVHFSVARQMLSDDWLTLFSENDEITMEFPRSWFRGSKLPQKGSKVSILQCWGKTILKVDGKQIYPLLNRI